MKELFFYRTQKKPLYIFFRDNMTEKDRGLLEDLYRTELKSWGSKRKADFLSGRHVAHYALKNNKTKITRGESGRPIFPNNLMGSIAHNEFYACAYINSIKSIRAVGIDVETLFTEETYAKVKHLIFTKNELELISDSLLLGTIIFSAKESLYKCLHPSYNRFIDFLEAETVCVSFQEKEFYLQIDERKIKGYFQIIDDSIFTLIESSGQCTVSGDSL